MIVALRPEHLVQDLAFCKDDLRNKLWLCLNHKYRSHLTSQFKFLQLAKTRATVRKNLEILSLTHLLINFTCKESCVDQLEIINYLNPRLSLSDTV